MALTKPAQTQGREQVQEALEQIIKQLRIILEVLERESKAFSEPDNEQNNQ